MSGYLYSLNVDGLIRQVKAQCIQEGACLVWKGYCPDKRYGAIHVGARLAQVLGYPNKPRWIRLTKLIWEYANGTTPVGLQHLHTCDNTRCIELSHLFLGSQYVNMCDKVAKDRQAKGERNGQAKLTQLHVAIIRDVWANSILPKVSINKVLRNRLYISQTTVYNVAYGYYWKAL